MKSWVEVVALGVLALVGCSESGVAVESAPDGRVAESKVDAVDPEGIPEDWVWVTDMKGRLEIAMPALPLVSPVPGQRVLQARTRSSLVRVVAAPVSEQVNVAALRASLEATGTVRQQTAWRGDGLGLAHDGPDGVVTVRAVVREGWLYTLHAIAMPPADAERFFGSFSARTEPRTGRLDVPERGYRVDTPSRMGAWRDLNGIPPLFGHRGMLDGHQFAVHATELVWVPNANSSLDGSVRNMRDELHGTVVQLDATPWAGRPSRRLELRAEDGMYATVRLVLDGTRLVHAAVYAPSGRKAPWADAYVDSLVIP